MEFLCARIVPIIGLVILPTVVIIAAINISGFTFLKIRDYYRDVTISSVKNISDKSKSESIIQQNISNTKLSSLILLFFQYAAILFLVIIYPIYPYIYSKESRFEKRGFENMVVEYESIKNILYFSLPLLIIGFPLLVIGRIPSISCITCAMHFTADPNIRQILIPLVVIGASSLLKTVCMFMKKEHRYYFAKGCFMFLVNEEDEGSKMKYLDLMLDSYNKYLQASVKFRIKDMNKIYTKLSYESIIKKVNLEYYSPISKAFGGDTLDLFRFLSTKFFKDQDTDQFLIKESFNEMLRRKLKQVGSLFAAAIPIAISLYQTLFVHSG
jgi:hypothetical protein